MSEQLFIHDFGNVGEVYCKDAVVPKLSCSYPQTGLSSPDSGGGAITYRVETNARHNLCVSRHYSLSEAVVEARRRVLLLAPGEEFTAQGLFGDVVLRGIDSRRRSSLIVGLRREGLVIAVGFTQQDQCGRNNGIATLWRKV